MNGVTRDRWSASQRLELHFWKTWTQAAPYQNLDVPKYWAEELPRFGCSRHLFSNKRVLDIGCGPVGLIHFLDNAAERIRIDPLLLQYESRMTLPEPQLSLAGLGESLPLASDSVDIAICFNALDHMQDPAAALAEIRRVLRPGGTLLLMIHSFPAWARPFFWIDRLASPSLDRFRIRYPSRLARSKWSAVRPCAAASRSRISKWILPSSWKYLAGNLVVASTYVRAKK